MKESERLSKRLEEFKAYITERNLEPRATIEALEKKIRKEKNRELAEGDGATINFYTDRHACTVIRKTKKMIVLQRDTATLKEDFKPDFDVGGFSAHCENNDKQEYTYERNPDGQTYRAFWSEKKGCYVADGCLKVSVGRHEFYDYNF